MSAADRDVSNGCGFVRFRRTLHRGMVGLIRRMPARAYGTVLTMILAALWYLVVQNASPAWAYVGLGFAAASSAFSLLLLVLVKRKDKELTSWILLEGERQRYHNVGEISGLIIHDLSSPLMAVSYSAQYLKKHPDKVADPRYLDVLVQNAERAEELVSSLRAYLRPPHEEAGGFATNCGQTMDYVLKLLKLRFSENSIDKISFNVGPGVHSLDLNLSNANVVHILINLLANSVENLRAHGTKDAKISIEVDAPSGSDEDRLFAVIYLSDNGSGLTEETFIQLTSSGGGDQVLTVGEKAPEPGKVGGRSMGLRLVRRLIECEGGAIGVLPSPRLGSGTTMRLRLERSPTSGTKGAAAIDTEDRHVS